MEIQRRDIVELRQTIQKLGLTVAKVTEAIQELTTVLKEQGEKEEED